MGLWNDQRADRRHANFMCLYANAHRDSKKNPNAFSAEDFMLFPTGKAKVDRNYHAVRAHLHSLRDKAK